MGNDEVSGLDRHRVDLRLYRWGSPPFEYRGFDHELVYLRSRGVPAKYGEVGAEVARLLGLQIQAIPSFSMFDINLYMELAAANYIYGLAEAALEAAGLPLTETEPGEVTVQLVLYNCMMQGPGPAYAATEQGLAICALYVERIRDDPRSEGCEMALVAGREDFVGLARRSDDARYMRFHQFFSTSPEVQQATLDDPENGNPDPSTEACDTAVRNASHLLDAQIANISDFSLLEEDGRIKWKPAAYVYGLVEAALHDAGVDLDEAGHGRATLACLLLEYVQTSRGSCTDALSKAGYDEGMRFVDDVIRAIETHARNRELATAVALGREDFARWAHRDPDASLRWATCFQ